MPPGNVTLNSGSIRSDVEYSMVGEVEIVGKTIEAIGTALGSGLYGDEPVTVFYFTDGTWHGFVHPGGVDW